MRNENIKSLISRKVISYNKAEENGDSKRCQELWQELNGMQQILKCMGISLWLSCDKDFLLHYTIEIT